MIALVSVASLAGFGVIVADFGIIGSDALALLACWSRHRLCVGSTAPTVATYCDPGTDRDSVVGNWLCDSRYALPEQSCKAHSGRFQQFDNEHRTNWVVILNPHISPITRHQRLHKV